MGDNRRFVDPAQVWELSSEDLFEAEDWQSELRERIADALRDGKFEIPPLPAVAVELNRIASSAEPDLRKATELVHRDAQLAGRVLALASSAAFGARSPITDLQKAVVRIGANGLRDIAFAVMMGKVFRCHPLDRQMQQVNARSYLMAAMSHVICRRLKMDSKLGFLCGLLADVGQLGLLALLADFSKENRAWLRRHVIDEAIATMHTEFGALICSRWALPAAIKEVALHHHDPQAAQGAGPLALAVAASDVIVGEGGGMSEPQQSPEERIQQLGQQPVIFYAGITPDQLPSLVETLDEVRRRAAAVFAQA